MILYISIVSFIKIYGHGNVFSNKHFKFHDTQLSKIGKKTNLLNKRERIVSSHRVRHLVQLYIDEMLKHCLLYR